MVLAVALFLVSFAALIVLLSVHYARQPLRYPPVPKPYRHSEAWRRAERLRLRAEAGCARYVGTSLSTNDDVLGALRTVADLPERIRSLDLHMDVDSVPVVTVECFPSRR